MCGLGRLAGEGVMRVAVAQNGKYNSFWLSPTPLSVVPSLVYRIWRFSIALHGRRYEKIPKRANRGRSKSRSFCRSVGRCRRERLGRLSTMERPCGGNALYLFAAGSDL